MIGGYIPESVTLFRVSGLPAVVYFTDKSIASCACTKAGTIQSKRKNIIYFIIYKISFKYLSKNEAVPKQGFSTALKDKVQTL
jgi:hypothetical protein